MLPKSLGVTSPPIRFKELADRPEGAPGASLEQELGGHDEHFIKGLIDQIVAAVSTEHAFNVKAANFALSVAKSVKPRDPLEAMLVAEASVVHDTMMWVSGAARKAMFSHHVEANLKMVISLARTYAMQMETLKRYRSSGEQKFTVQHVSVDNGAQAVVNFADTPEEQRHQQAAVSRPALTHSKVAPMEILEPEKDAVEAPRRAGARK
jgi:hypothetical protein